MRCIFWLVGWFILDGDNRSSSFLDRSLTVGARGSLFFYMISPAAVASKAIACLTLRKHYGLFFDSVIAQSEFRNNHVVTDDAQELLCNHGILPLQVNHHILLDPKGINCTPQQFIHLLVQNTLNFTLFGLLDWLANSLRYIFFEYNIRVSFFNLLYLGILDTLNLLLRRPLLLRMTTL